MNYVNIESRAIGHLLPVGQSKIDWANTLRFSFQWKI